MVTDMNTFKLNGVESGSFMRPYIIAEIGVNHEGSLDRAKKMIREAAQGGAHAAKFQTYKAGKLAAKESPAYWDLSKEPTRSQRELFAKYDAFGPAEYQALAEYSNEVGIHFVSTPFDLEAVDTLDPLVPFFKIASADILNVPLLRKVAKTGKPVVMSTGAATLPEIEFSIETLTEAGATQIVLLHCVLNYPTPIDHAQIARIATLQRIFPNLAIGYSDHVAPDDTMTSLEVATLLGAVVLEKHFTDDRSAQGNDHYHAMDEQTLRKFNEKLSLLSALTGEEGGHTGNEADARKYARRSIVAARDIEEGEVLDESALVTKRPGTGIGSEHWDQIVGLKATRPIEADTLLHWNDVEL